MEKNLPVFSSILEKSTFFRAQVSGGHRYETALDFLFLPNDWSSDISPYPQIILLHPLLAPQSSPLSPQFSDKTLFLECNARCTDTSVSTVSDPLSLCLIPHLYLSVSVSLFHGPLRHSVFLTASFSLSLSSLISMFLSAMVAL